MPFTNAVATHMHVCIQLHTHDNTKHTFLHKHWIYYLNIRMRVCVFVPRMRFYVRGNIPTSICISKAKAGNQHRNTCAEQLVQTRRIHA